MVKLKKLWIPLVIALTLALLLVGNRACNLYDENSVLKGRDEAMTAQLEIAVESLHQFRKENTALVTQLEIQRNLLTGVIEEAGEAAETMVAGLRTVEYLKANAENDKALIVEMEIELDKRDVLIEKLFFTIQRQETRYFTLNKRYTIAKREIDLADIAIQGFRESINIKDLRIKGLEKSLKGMRFAGQLKNGAIVAITLWVVYGLVT